MSRLFAALFLTSQICWLSSCSKGYEPELPPTSPVTGTVHVDGKPMAGVVVLLFPVDNYPEFVDPNFLSPHRGGTDADGKFQITTYKQNDGAPAGEYIVSFYWAGNLKIGGLEVEAEERVDPAAVKFNRLNGSPAKSPVENIKIEAGQPVDVGTIALKSK